MVRLLILPSENCTQESSGVTHMVEESSSGIGLLIKDCKMGLGLEEHLGGEWCLSINGFESLHQGLNLDASAYREPMKR